ncbi:MAG: outer membrane beta-barrel protein [Cyclobacteriaceae bacterium]
MGKLQFEDNWKDVFEGAEYAVSESVWEKVEMDLVRMENKTNKTRVIFYQRVAAMVALFALMMAAYIAYERAPLGADELQIAENNISADTNGIEDTSASMNEGLNTSKKGDNNIDNHTGTTSSLKSRRAVILSNTSSTSLISEVAFVDLNPVHKTSHLIAFVPDFPSVEVKIKSKNFYEPNFPRQLPAMPSYLMTSSKSDKGNDKLYASLGFAGGSYSPGAVSSSPSSFSRMTGKDSFIMAQVEPQSEQASIGTAYSIGVNAGKQLSKRWAIQSGLGYVVQNIDYTSNYTSVAPDNSLRATVADYADNETMIAISPPYSIRSVNKYLSIPVQVGYKLVDRKIGLQLNAGISTDFFLNNTLRDDSGLTESYTQSAGERSPYRSINWSGLMGLELSHQLADRYQVALVPGIRYALNSALKDDAEVSYNPLVLDVGLRVKYIFK